MMNIVDFINEYEAGELDEDGIIDGFQTLIDTGLAWSLQGHYGRTATMLIEAPDRSPHLRRPVRHA